MPKALKAIVNSHPFATRRASAQRAVQEESPPPDGADSYYGVRSIQSSVSWSSDGSDSTALAPGHAPRPVRPSLDSAGATGGDLKSVRDVRDDPVRDEHGDSDDEHTDDDTGSSSEGSEARESTPDASRSLQLHTPAPPGHGQLHAHTYTHAQGHSRAQEPTSNPPSTCDTEGAAAALAQAAPTAHIAHAPAVLTRERSRSVDKLAPVVSHALFDMLQDAPSASEPSSPASLASLPSCTASMSSLSRLSSPADWDQRAHFARSGASASVSGASVAGERQELVLPTLALPNTSLHLGLERWAGEGAGTRIALVAPPERTRDILAVIAGKRKCVQLAHGEVGVVAQNSSGHGELEATIITGLGANDIARRTHDAYALLHSLLNPSPDPEKQAEIAKIVTAHSVVADWVHLAFVMEGMLFVAPGKLTSDEDDLAALDIVPVTTLEQEMRRERERQRERDRASMETPRWSAGNLEPWTFDAGISGLPGVPESSSTSSPRSPLSLPSDPPSYPSSLPSSSSDEEPDPVHEEPTPPGTPDAVRQAANALEALLSDERVRAASVAAFLAWHPESPGASTLVAEPQPTLAHAGGEWEATLSRRLAARRELDQAAHAAARRRATPRGRRTRRRKSTSPTPPCGPGPLFPRRSAPLATGLAGLFESVFAPVKKWRPWAIVAAIAVAVGCGIWAVRAA